MAVNGVALAAGSAGIVLLWSAIENQHITTTIQDIVKGEKPSPGPETVTTASDSGSSGSGASGSSAPSAPVSVSGNVALGKIMAAAYGWTGSNWNSLYALWERESGWNNKAENGSSGAYGIAQALGHGPTNQYPAGSANPPVSSASAQIAWGLSYIKSRYGNPNAAWTHEESAGWY